MFDDFRVRIEPEDIRPRVSRDAIINAWREGFHIDEPIAAAWPGEH